MSVSVGDIMKRMKEQMKEQRLGKPLMAGNRPRTGEAYSGKVALSERVVKKENKVPRATVPASCEKYSAKGFGAATMTVPQLIEFLKKKAPKPVFDKFSRLQKKTRPELCKLLSEFEAGYRLLYPANKPKSPEPELPAANNIEGMLNLAQKLQRTQASKNAKKIAERYNAFGSFVPVSPSSPASLASNSPGTPNYVNYANNNNAPSEEARMRERNAYLRKLAEKRVVRDPMEGKLSAANMKRLQVRPLVKTTKSTSAPKRKPNSPPKLMKISTTNGRAPTLTTRGLTVATGPRVNRATMRAIKNKAAAARNSLEKLLKSFQNVPLKQRPAMMRTRIRFLKKILNDPNLNKKLLEKEKYRVTILQNLGLKSPPKPNSPPARPFSSMSIRNLTPAQAKRLAKITGKKQANAPVPQVNASAIRQRYEKSILNNLVSLRNFMGPLTLKNTKNMNSIRSHISSFNIKNFKLEGRNCMSYKKSQLVKVARLLTKESIRHLESFTKEELCQIIKHNLTKK